MKIISKNLKQGEISVIPESNSDLWYLTQIISVDDIISGKTQRKIKLNETSDPVKKTFFMSLSVEKIDFKPDILRVNGKIVEGPEDVSKGSYQAFNVEIGKSVKITKKKWLTYHLKNLDEAVNKKQDRFLICIFDRDSSVFALTKAEGYEKLGSISGAVAKKAFDVSEKENFYQKIIKEIKEYDERYSPSAIIIASPAFWKEELLKEIKDEDIKKKIVQATCAGVNEKSISEVLKRDEVKTALKDERLRRELILIEKLLSEISKEGLAVYGIKNVSDAVLSSAVSVLLISTEYINKKQEDGSFSEINQLMEFVDKNKGEIQIVSSDNDSGKQLDGLGGIAALLRFKI